MMNGVNWNYAAASQYGLGNCHVPQVSPVNVGCSPAFSQGNVELMRPQERKSSHIVATVVALAAATTAVVLARKGKILKSGKFGGKLGDWIRNFKLSNLKFGGEKKIDRTAAELGEEIKKAQHSAHLDTAAYFSDDALKTRKETFDALRSDITSRLN